jgi:hypothetical protein
MPEKKYPVFADANHVFCFNCKLPVTGPFQSSGFAVRHGAWKGQCTGPRGCGMITFFDWEADNANGR